VMIGSRLSKKKKKIPWVGGGGCARKLDCY